MFTVKIQNEDSGVTHLFSYQDLLFIGPSEELMRQIEFETEHNENFHMPEGLAYWGKVADLSTDKEYWLTNGDSLYVTDMSGKTVLMERSVCASCEELVQQ